MLLEALIAILIFSFGILAIVGLQAAAIKNSGDAKYRTDASQLANQLLGQMWASDRIPANMVTNFSSPNGANYLAWTQDVINSGLPVSTTGLPAVAIATMNNLDSSGNLVESTSVVTITITWKAPNENDTHQYTTVAHIL